MPQGDHERICSHCRIHKSPPPAFISDGGFAMVRNCRLARFTFVLVSAAVLPAWPATFSVNTTADCDATTCAAGQLSLRAALALAADGNANIVSLPAGQYLLDPGLGTLTLGTPCGEEGCGAGPDPDIRIAGEGSAVTVIDGQGQIGSILALESGTLEVLGVAIRNGADPFGSGGGVVKNAGTFSADDLVLSGGTTTSAGGGLYNSGVAYLRNFTVTANQSDVSGGGIYNVGALYAVGNYRIENNTATYGGGIANDGLLFLNSVDVSFSTQTGSDDVYCDYQLNCTTPPLGAGSISNNAAQQGGAINNDNLAFVTNATMANNTATQYGGAIENGNTLELVNVTLDGNTAGLTGGGVDNSCAAATLVFVTVTGNGAGQGGGIYAGCVSPFAQTRLVAQNSIFAGNTPQNCDADKPAHLPGHAPDLGSNLDIGGSCAFTAPGDFSPPDAGLGALQHNGGPAFLLTRAPQPTSPAVGAAAKCTAALDGPVVPTIESTTGTGGEPTVVFLRADETGNPQQLASCTIGALETAPQVASVGVVLDLPVAIAASTSPQTFTATATVRNTGTGPVTQVTAQIAVDPSLAISGSAVVSLGTLAAGATAIATWTITTTPDCHGDGGLVRVSADFAERTSPPPHDSKSVSVAGYCGSLSGAVFHTEGPAPGPNAPALPGAEVDLVPGADGPSFVTQTDGSGSYSFADLPPGNYQLSIHGTADFPRLITFTEIIILQPGLVLTASPTLSWGKAIPLGISMAPNRTVDPNHPVIYYDDEELVQVRACPGSLDATWGYEEEYKDLGGGGVETVLSGVFTEAEDEAGLYVAHVPPLYPVYGNMKFVVKILCPDELPDGLPDELDDDFDLYVDPSGKVVNQLGTPIAGATVTLLQRAGGVFGAVPDGSVVMSPATRQNPQLTDAHGHFGWDVLQGSYELQAQAGPHCSTAVAGPFDVPPPITGLSIALACDLTPPISTATPREPPNVHGWNDGPVTVDLSAHDSGAYPAGGSGVASISVSLGGAQTLAAIIPGGSGSVTVSAQGTTTLTWFATDNAGNAEAPHTLVLRIDDTPPEVFIRFDPESRQLLVFATDALSGAPSNPVAPVASSQKGDRQTEDYVVSDLAGNTLELTLVVDRDRRSTQASVESLRYNGASPLRVQPNRIAAAWDTGRSDTLRELVQAVQLAPPSPSELAQWEPDDRDHDGDDGRTTIVIGPPRRVVVVPGLALLTLSTGAGSLSGGY